MTAQNTQTENAADSAAFDDRTDSDEFSRAFGESLDDVLNAASWTAGADLANTYARMEHEVRLAADQERRVANAIREELFPRIEASALAGPVSGVYQATLEQIDSILNGLLLNGNVEACDGISMIHETLALTFIQIGVCLVTYDGDQQTWSQRMFRRDYRPQDGGPLVEMLAILNRRRSDHRGVGRAADRISRLARRGIQAYAQRMFLTRRSTAWWKMCQGDPAPFELITGAGLVGPDESGKMAYPLMRAGVAILRELLMEHRRFVFVPRRVQDRSMLTIGQALYPLEYAIIDTISDQIEAVERTGHYDENQRAVAARFREDVGDAVVRGVFRASGVGPPQVFYAHRDHAHVAALIAIADSVLQEHRSYPTLLDLAQTVCQTTFGVDSFVPQLRIAYTDAGAAWTTIDR